MKRRSTISLASAIAAAFTLWVAPAFAQQDPTELGGGKKAYVLLIIDSSASMEYTDDGDNRFPIMDCGADGLCPGMLGYPGPDVGEGDFQGDQYWIEGGPEWLGAKQWLPGDAMELTDTAASYDSVGFEAFGPCYVWEPTDPGGACGDYRRPAWRMQPGPSFTLPTVPNEWETLGFDGLTDAISREVRWTGGFVYGPKLRLQDESQPRHVTIKEVLTGDMVLLPEYATNMNANNYNAADYGPGCWFVPRQRDASVQPLADQNYCKGVAEFEQYPDFDQPVPHFQEVWDVQYTNGVLDQLGTSALFAVAAFDSYREKLDWHGYNKALDDEMGGSYPQDPSGIRNNKLNEDSGDCDGDDTFDDDCYNLGIWHVIGPSDLEIPATLLPEIAAYTQVAINDTGYLNPKDDDDFKLFVDDKKSKKNGWLGTTFSKTFKKYAEDLDLGKQPIARATPLAAAIQDVYQFMSDGQGSGGNAIDPINDDAFAECRPKHVVLLTDGQPEPERDPNNPGGRSSTLNEAFGYDITRYSYDTVEGEIEGLVDDINNSVPPSNSAPVTDRDKYNVRVHVVGLNLDTGDPEALAKMAQMAIEGHSCASALVPDRVPNTYNYDEGGGSFVPGTCVPGTGCLVPQSAYVSAYTSNYTWTHPASGDIYDCNDFPALVLDNNEAQVLASALSSFLSNLVDTSGLSSRTRLVVSNRLDDDAISAGGQYRVYSGVRVGGGSAWWKGVLNRTTLRCDGVGAPEVSLDQDVGTQVSLTAPTVADSRRVWTAVPDDTRWCYEAPCAVGEPLPITSANTLLPFSYDLRTATDDEFQGSYIASPSFDPALVVGTRVPFEHDEIESAFPAAVPPYAEYNVADQTELQEVVNVFRARIPERVSAIRGGNLPPQNGVTQDRVIDGILNSNPIVVGPPNLDLAIGSYRDFRARYADRSTMMYVSSMGGLLHALHMGTLANKVALRAMTPENTVPGADGVGSAAQQREAWAYMPWMLHKDISSHKVAQSYLMDGTPTAKDVRLCNQDPSNNTNVQACVSLCPGGGCGSLPGVDQWRTVLVQGRGQAGAGYYAMDVTRPGGPQLDYTTETIAVQTPDPILLWEFDREWEKRQLEYFYADPSLQERTTGVDPDSSVYSGADCGNNLDTYWKSPLLGLSVSEPEIATVIVEGQQRPVAVFGGGGNDVNASGCGSAASGMAIYVVDLQTGTLLRRFTDYVDGGPPISFTDDSNRFVGTPALFDSSTGAIATRGFIGDDSGRLFRIDLLDQDPTKWEVSLFFDPYADLDLPAVYSAAGHSGAPTWGPAAFRPAIALNSERDVMVVYGLGEVGDVVTNNQAQAMIALTEKRSDPTTGVIAWAEVFAPGEKVTGAPLIFNGEVYFPTYALPTADLCDPGFARIWGLKLADQDLASLDTVGIFAGNPAFTGPPLAGILLDPAFKWFGPDEPTLVRGLTITLGQLCSTDDIGSDNPVFSTGDRPKPQLIAQTSGPIDNDLRNRDEAASPLPFNALDRVVLDIEPPASQTLPLSWSLLF